VPRRDHSIEACGAKGAEGADFFVSGIVPGQQRDRARGLSLMLAPNGVRDWRWSVAPAQERWLGLGAGLAPGLITAATGVFVIPAVPCLQAIGGEREDLALGLAFTLATLALAGNLTGAGLGGEMLSPASLLALGIAGAAWDVAPVLRLRLKPLSCDLLRWPVRPWALSRDTRALLSRGAAS
jgi:uncharacterized protein